MMKTASKALAGTVAAGAMALSPAFASDSHGYDRDGIAAAADNTSHYGADYDFTRAGYRGFDGRYGEGNQGWNMNSRQAVQMCTSQAVSMASRQSYGRANVTDVRDVRNTGRGFEVRGRIAVNSMGQPRRNGDNRFGWNNNFRGRDSGSFTCKVERGRVVDMDFDGIRGL